MSTIIRTERGLSIKGTRVTLYQFMDYLCAGQSWEIIAEDFPQLTEEQLGSARIYIEANYSDIEAEYQIVLQKAQKTEQYWRTLNKDIQHKMSCKTLDPDRAKLMAKLRATQAQLSVAA